jgi:hypothetical protein
MKLEQKAKEGREYWEDVVDHTLEGRILIAWKNVVSLIDRKQTYVETLNQAQLDLRIIKDLIREGVKAAEKLEKKYKLEYIPKPWTKEQIEQIEKDTAEIGEILKGAE